MLKTFTVVGTRPQFVKIALLRKRFLEAGFDDFLVHTGQHYDENMSGNFFKEFDVPLPDANLGVTGQTHGAQTASMLSKLEALLIERDPDCVVVAGDTNSTLAGALAAAKMGIPIAHLEAGVRSYDWAMPEEVNRVLVDRMSQLRFVPTAQSVSCLAKEGITDGVHIVGDVMLDVLQCFKPIAEQPNDLRERLEIGDHPYVLATCHRQENTDDVGKLSAILDGLGKSGLRVVLPLHPRTRERIGRFELEVADNVSVIEPIGYLDFMRLQIGASAIATDSGGVQKEAYWLGVPCVTMREQTEWTETVENGWNVLVGTDAERICQALVDPPRKPNRPDLYGLGNACSVVVDTLKTVFESQETVLR